MAAELEFAAWSSEAVKLWSMFVEPPWSHEVCGERIELDVMGRKTAFTVRPDRPRHAARPDQGPPVAFSRDG